MYAKKLGHLHLAEVDIPYHDLVNGKVETGLVSRSFIIDTGASISVIPISMLICEELLELEEVQCILLRHPVGSYETASNTSEVTGFYLCLKNIIVLGHEVPEFHCLVTLDCDTALLGCDFVDSCTFYHTAASSWDFRSFDVNRYDDIWRDTKLKRNIYSAWDGMLKLGKGASLKSIIMDINP